MSKKKWIYYPSKYYVDFFRGTPLLVQILLIHLALIPAIFGHSLGYFVSGSLALILNSAAYNAEIIRAGIQSIEKGQTEAARSLGMTAGTAMKLIILPQAFRRMVPPLGNELIALLKDSSLVTVIAANDLLYAGKVVAGAHLRFWEPYITVAIIIFDTYVYFCDKLLRMWKIDLVIVMSHHLENEFSNLAESQRKVEAMIKIQGLHKSFGDLEVLKGIDYEVKEKEVVCVIGPSGSGKSTFLRCINLLEDITDG